MGFVGVAKKQQINRGVTKEENLKTAERREEVVMVIMTMLTGPWAGQVRSMPPSIDPLEIITATVQHGWRWQVTYHDAIPEEIFEWARADLIGRILLGLQEGRSIWFQGVEFRAEKSEKISEVAGKIEDAVTNSGMLVHVERDDEQGVLIGTGGTELPVQ